MNGYEGKLHCDEGERMRTVLTHFQSRVVDPPSRVHCLVLPSVG